MAFFLLFLWVCISYIVDFARCFDDGRGVESSRLDGILGSEINGLFRLVYESCGHREAWCETAEASSPFCLGIGTSNTRALDLGSGKQSACVGISQ